MAEAELLIPSLPRDGFAGRKDQPPIRIEIHLHCTSGTEFTGDDFPADRCFYQLLDRPSQRPSSEVGIEPFVRDVTFYGFGDFQGYTLSGGQPPNTIEEEIGYLYKLSVSQSMENDNLIYPVQKLRSEDLPELLHQESVDLLIAVSHLLGARNDFCADITGHDYDGVLKGDRPALVVCQTTILKDL